MLNVKKKTHTHTHTLYLYIVYDSYNKQPLFPYTIFTDWSV